MLSRFPPVMPIMSGPHVALDSLELWVRDLAKTKRIFTNGFGFERGKTTLEFCSDEEAVCLICGNVNLIIRQGKTPTDPISSYVAKHGDSVANIILICDEVDVIVEKALVQGLKVSSENGCPRIDLLGDGTIFHSLCERGMVSRPKQSNRHNELQMKAIDHIAYCLPWGMMDHLAMIYREVFALEKVQVENIQGNTVNNFPDNTNGMRSIALRSPLGFTVVLTEPMTATSIGQTQQFLRAHAGPGIQHIAFAYDDIVEAVETLSLRKVPFLPIPKAHIEHSHQRLRDHKLPWNILHQHQILVDADENGLLFQLFTRPLTDQRSFFVELIQRAGATGFGSMNIQALYAAIDAAICHPTKPMWSTSNTNSRSEETIWIEKLVNTARARIPFYNNHLASVDILDLALLPSFDKSMIVGHGRFPLSSGGASGAYRVLATSGTSGNRLFVGFSNREWERTANWLKEVGRRVGITSEDVLLNTHCYGLWVGGPALDLLANSTGAGLVPLGPTDPANVLNLLADGVGTAISATPSYLRRLIEAAHTTGIDLRKTALRFGFIGAEGAEESLRRKLVSHLPEGFEWIELYGLTETGGPAVAFAPDPTVPELELNTQDFWVEVLDLAADQPVKRGDVGELTITTRQTDGRTPLIRYRTRDLVRVMAGDPNAPTRISRILGRVDESLKVGGVLVYPSSIAEIMSEFMPATAEWRARIHHQELDNELLIEAEASQDLCHTIELAFKQRIGFSLTIIPAQAGALARNNQKTQRILIDSSTTSDLGKLSNVVTEEACQ